MKWWMAVTLMMYILAQHNATDTFVLFAHAPTVKLILNKDNSIFWHRYVEVTPSLNAGKCNTLHPGYKSGWHYYLCEFSTLNFIVLFFFSSLETFILIGERLQGLDVTWQTRQNISFGFIWINQWKWADMSSKQSFKTLQRHWWTPWFN